MEYRRRSKSNPLDINLEIINKKTVFQQFVNLFRIIIRNLNPFTQKKYDVLNN